MDRKSSKYIRSWLEPEIGRRTGYIRKDIRAIMNAFRDIVEERIVETAEELRNSNDLDSAIALSFRGLFDVTVRKIKPYDGNKFFYGDENSDEFIRVTYKPSRSYIPLVNNRRNRKIEKFSFEEEKKADDLKNQ